MDFSKQRYYNAAVRERVLNMRFVEHMKLKDISDVLGGHPCGKTVGHIVSSYLQQGEMVVPAGQKGMLKEYRKFDCLAAEVLVDLVQSNDQLLLVELAYKMEQLAGGGWTVRDVCRALGELNYVRKVVFTRPTEADPRQQQLYRDLVAKHGYTYDQYVFFDEVAADSRVTNKKYAYVQRGELSKAHSLFVRGARYTTIAAMWAGGIVARRTLEGAATSEEFLDFFVSDVMPSLQPWPEERSVVVFDNCAIHKKQVLQTICKHIGVECLFLPPYSPIYNPIEQLFKTVKQWLKSNRAWVWQVPALCAIDTAFRSITAEACTNWIRAVHIYDKE